MGNKRKRKTRRKADQAARRESYEANAAYRAWARQMAAIRKAESERFTRKTLEEYTPPERKFRELELDYRLRREILKRAKKLIEPEYFTVLKAVEACTWFRDPKDWRPKGKSGYTLFKSLARHLLVKYTMPDFMFSAFLPQPHPESVKLFTYLGEGGSLYKAVKEGFFPVPLTKRMCHVFMQSPARFNIVEAIRHAQVKVWGGDQRLAEAIAATHQLRILNPDEDFWATVIQWVCNQPMFDPDQVAPVFDWIGHMRGQNRAFSMKGRTGVSVLRAMEEWHGELAKLRKIEQHVYYPSGFLPWYHEREAPVSGGAYVKEKHCITEILSSKELALEGKALRHCVYSYSWRVQAKAVSIWSYKIDGKRTLTIEVNNQMKRVVQVRGLANRSATPGELDFVQRWARNTGLCS